MLRMTVTVNQNSLACRAIPKDAELFIVKRYQAVLLTRFAVEWGLLCLSDETLPLIDG